MTLDQRIEEDLKDLYDSGILKFIEQFKNCKIKEAEELSKNLFDTPNELSSHGYIDKDDKGNIRIDNFDIKQAAFLKAWVDQK